jgi:Flp pilus assembly protein TadD
MPFIRSSYIRSLCLGASAAILSACAVASGYTEQEQSIVDSLQPGLYQPASRQDRDSIETQDLLAQAAFWSREAQLNPADLETAIKLTAAVRKLGNAARAVDISQTARAMHPSNPYLLAEYAASLIADERGTEAIKPLQQGLRTTPAYARLWSLMGAALDQQENYPQARRHYERALKITPNDPNVLANMGLSFALEGQAAVAEHWLRRAAAQPGASEGVSQNLALVLQLQGKAPEGRLAETQSPASQQNLAPRPNRVRVEGAGAPPAPRARSSAASPAHSYHQAGRAAAQGYPQPGGSAPNIQGQGYQGQSYQGQMGNGRNFSFGIGEPKSASEAARMAARQSNSRKVRVPVGEPIPGQFFRAAPQGQGPQGQGPQGQHIQGEHIQGQPVQGGVPYQGGAAQPQYNPAQAQHQPPYYQPQYPRQPRPRGAARRR